jgi:hypothetical protein
MQLASGYEYLKPSQNIPSRSKIPETPMGSLRPLRRMTVKFCEGCS